MIHYNISTIDQYSHCNWPFMWHVVTAIHSVCFVGVVSYCNTLSLFCRCCKGVDHSMNVNFTPGYILLQPSCSVYTVSVELQCSYCASMNTSNSHLPHPSLLLKCSICYLCKILLANITVNVMAYMAISYS